MIVTSKKNKAKLVLKTVAFFLVFIVIVGGSLLLYTWFAQRAQNQLESDLAASAQPTTSVSQESDP